MRPNVKERPLNAQPSPKEINTLVALFNSGKLAEAAPHAQAMTARFPRHWVGWKMLGVIFMQMGQNADALLPMQRAASLLPKDAETHNNLAITLSSLGRHEDAEASCRQALALNPAYVEAHGNLGVALQDRGLLNEAEASYRQALALAPDYARAHNNLGALLQSQQRLGEAEACFRKALVLMPNDVDTLDNLAGLLDIQAQPALALEQIMVSLQIRETVRATRIFAACIQRLHFTQIHPQIRSFLVRALDAPWDRPVELARISSDFIKLDPVIGSWVTHARSISTSPSSMRELFGQSGLDTLAADELLCALLAATQVCDMALEHFLTLARRAILLAPCMGTSLNFHSALAQQCFINEYVFALDDDEIQQANALRDALEAALATNSDIPALWPLTVAAYFPLGSLPSASRLLERQWPAAVGKVLVQQVIEPVVEQVFRTSIPTLTAIEDDVSLQVQKQYEENPYPRWIKAAPVDETYDIGTCLKQKFPLANIKDFAAFPQLDILIAGCGTGQHSTNRARALLNTRILAIDLSLGSLAYAKRKTHEMGLSTIEYAHADLLKLGTLGRDFAVIESVGVLHHLADPWAGWRTLLTLLRPGGFMKLGFYSELARQHIVWARNFIAEQGYETSVDGIRRCRQDLMALPDQTKLGNLLRVTDFYSTSACRDLLFHVQEHRLSIPDIAAFLRDNALNFLGFEVEPDILKAYQQRFPHDLGATNLDNWQEFEQDNPDIFFGMYQFWVQK
jgi:Flp pilus assembly protein TadD/2-polyprenyl-3-methyl-5-hydroxy-6-metoxy-1,4-benzoquinol methylase